MEELEYDLIAGIPYTALPIASIISINKKVPMIYARKEAKDYGTKKKIEGKYERGQTCVVIDDLITTGDSKFETAAPFEEEGLKVKDFIVLIDREQGGGDLLKSKGYSLHSILPITELLDTLSEKRKITAAEYKKATEFIEKNKVSS